MCITIYLLMPLRLVVPVFVTTPRKLCPRDPWPAKLCRTVPGNACGSKSLIPIRQGETSHPFTVMGTVLAFNIIMLRTRLRTIKNTYVI